METYRIIKSYDSPYCSFELHQNVNGKDKAEEIIADDCLEYLTDEKDKGDFEYLNFRKDDLSFSSFPIDKINTNEIDLFAIRAYKEIEKPKFIMNPEIDPNIFLRYLSSKLEFKISSKFIGIQDIYLYSDKHLTFKYDGCSLELYEKDTEDDYYWDMVWDAQDYSSLYALGMFLNYLRDKANELGMDIYDDIFDENKCHIHFIKK